MLSLSLWQNDSWNKHFCNFLTTKCENSEEMTGSVDEEDSVCYLTWL